MSVFITIPLYAAETIGRGEPDFTVGTRVRYLNNPKWEGVITQVYEKHKMSQVRWDNPELMGHEYDSFHNKALTILPQSQFTFSDKGIQVNASVVKTAISLPELVRETNAFSKKYRPGCSAKLLDSNPKALFLHYNVKCNKEDSDPAGHDVRVQFDITHVQESQQAKDLDLQVSCSCPAFLYWGAQWNLHQRDGLLGTPRPKLVSPTERLDLRGNFVICKHLHAVFERILPSVQHNIVKILRDREVLRNKEKMKETPERLKEKQDEMKKKKELEKIRNEKDKGTQDKMMDALKEEEEGRLLHEQQLENQGAPGTTTPEEEAPMAPAPDVAPGDEDIHALEELARQEEEKIQEQHKQHQPHNHQGLPYEVHTEEDEDEEEEGWTGARLSRLAATFGDISEGSKVRFDANPQSLGEVLEIRKNPTNPQQSIVKVKWSQPIEQVFELPIHRLRQAEQMGLFASQSGTMAKIAMRWEDIKKGMKVVYIESINSGKRMIGDVIAKGNSPEKGVEVKWAEGHTSVVDAWRIGRHIEQKSLYPDWDEGTAITANYEGIPWDEIAPGDKVKMLELPYSDDSFLVYGTVLSKNKKMPYSPVMVRWEQADGWNEEAKMFTPIESFRAHEAKVHVKDLKRWHPQKSMMFEEGKGIQV